MQRRESAAVLPPLDCSYSDDLRLDNVPERSEFVKRKLIAQAMVVVLPMLLALSVALVSGGAPAGAATDRLPDLRMARLQDLSVESAGVQRRLRFDSIIVNIGAGKLELRGSRPSTATPEMTVVQRIFSDAGGFRDRPTDARMYFAGDGHNHWHVRDLEDYKLNLLINGKKRSLVGTGAKHGFCFYDNYPFGSTQPAFYTGCANGQPNALQVTTGLSRRWGDLYNSTLPDQYIDITGLPPGDYRLTATADPDDWFEESSNRNNYTWVDILISIDQVSVIRQGPGAG